MIDLIAVHESKLKSIIANFRNLYENKNMLDTAGNNLGFF